MNPQQVIEQAIEALEDYYKHTGWESKSTDDLRALLEQMKKQEPVAWMGEYNINDIRDHYTVVMRHKASFDGAPDRVRPLCTTPPLPQREGWQWVPVEATPKMVDATWDEPIGVVESHNSRNKRIYKAMLQAAPKPTEE